MRAHNSKGPGERDEWQNLSSACERPWVWSPAQKQGNKHASKQATKTIHRCLLQVRPLRANFIIRVLTSPMGYSTDQLVDKWTIRRWDIVGRSRSLVTLLWRQYLDPSPFPVHFSTSGYQGRLGSPAMLFCPTMKQGTQSNPHWSLWDAESEYTSSPSRSH